MLKVFFVLKANQNQMITMSDQLSRALGFENRIHNLSNVLAINIVAENEIAFLADAFVVMLRDLKCESFDGFQNKRSNIIAVLSATPTTRGQVNYEVDNLVFIDLNNAQPVSIRNLRARLLTNDLKPLNVESMSSMTLLLDV